MNIYFKASNTPKGSYYANIIKHKAHFSLLINVLPHENCCLKFPLHKESLNPLVSTPDNNLLKDRAQKQIIELF